MARTLGIEIDAHVVRGVVVQSSFRGTSVERYVSAPILTSAAPPRPPAAPTPPSVPAASPLPLTGLEPDAPETGVTAAGDPFAPAPAPLDPTPAPTPTDLADQVTLTPVQRAVKEVLAQCGRPPERIVAHLSGEHASLRRVSLPAGALKHVGDVLPHQLDELVPFPIDEAIIDHQMIGVEDMDLHVLAGAVRREHVAERLGELKNAGIDVRELALGAASLDGLAGLSLRSLMTPGSSFLDTADSATAADLAGSDDDGAEPEETPDPVVMVVELGHTHTDVAVLRGSACLLGRTITGGLDAIYSHDEVRIDALKGALRRTLSQLRMQGEPTPDRVVLGGEGANEPTAIGLLQDALGVGAQVIDLPDAEGAPFEMRPRFMRAAALAGRSVLRGKRMDLRQGEFASTHAMGQIRKYARLVAMCAAAVLFSFAISLYARYSVAKAERAELEQQLDGMTAEIFGASSRTSSPTRAGELLRGQGTERNPIPRLDAYRAMGALADILPEDIDHATKRLTIEYDDEARKGRLEIQGTVASAAQRDALAEALAAHECFDDVRPGATSLRNEILTYRLEAEIRCPGEQTEDADEGDSRNNGRRRRGR